MWQGASKVARISLGLVDQLHTPRCALPDQGSLVQLINDSLETL
jgi:hypothetical protein